MSASIQHDTNGDLWIEIKGKISGGDRNQRVIFNLQHQVKAVVRLDVGNNHEFWSYEKLGSDDRSGKTLMAGQEVEFHCYKMVADHREGYPDSEYTVKIFPFAQRIADAGSIVGEIRAFAASESASEWWKKMYSLGWVECDGRSLKNADFPELYRAIGDNWGSEDIGHVFNIPDLRGVFMRGWHHDHAQAPSRHGRPGDPDRGRREPIAMDINSPPGSKGAAGDRIGSYQLDEVRSHRHSYLDSSIGGEGSPIGWGSAQRHMVRRDTDNTGGSESRPANVYVAYLIYTGRRL